MRLMHFSYTRRCLGLALVCLVVTLPAARAYELEGYHWPSNQPIVMDVQLGTPGYTLLDRSPSWNQVAEDALEIWNLSLGSQVQFAVTNAVITPAERDGINSVFFSDTVFGESFGNDVLAVTLSFFDKRTRIKTEADVIFSQFVRYDSYRGPLRHGIYDLRRIALHEFGHVLGLEHTPQASQSIMTPVVTDIDSLQADDIAGVEAIYGPPTPVLPAITGGLTAVGQPGVPFSYEIAASNSPDSYTANGLPPGLIVNPTSGQIYGTPTTSGSYSVAISATNRAGTTTATLLITITLSPVITSPLAVTTPLYQPFSYQVSAAHFPTSFAASNVSAGLTFDATTGLLSGIPTSIGTFPITLTAANGVGKDTQSLMLKVVLTKSALVTLHTFTGPDGAYPFTPMVQGRDGNFYGTTNVGGATNHGSAYKLTPDGLLTTIYSFSSAGSSDNPSTFAQGNDDNFYGTTLFGGDHGSGTFFRLAPDGVFTTLHSFNPNGDVGISRFPLILATDGSFYGSDGAYTVFAITPDGVLTTVCFLDVANGRLAGPLIQATDGCFYGMTAGSALLNNRTDGVIFQVTPAGAVTVLHRFDTKGGFDGSGSLVQGRDGNLYGFTSGGGANGAGTFFRLTSDGQYTVLNNLAALQPLSGSTLILAGDGNFYGTTLTSLRGGFNVPLGGNYPSGDGTIFKVTPNGRYSVLHVFDSTDSAGPTGLIVGQDGALYVTTSGYSLGGIAYGKLFKLPLNSASSDDDLPTVTLAATTPEVTVGSGGSAVLTLTLSAAQTTNTIVHYTIKGTAVNGTDYVELTGTKKIKAGKLSKPIKVIPQGSLGGASKKTVKLKLTPGDGYTVGTTGKIKVNLVAPMH